MTPDRQRRRLVLGMAGLVMSGTCLAARLAATPAQTAGPFYPEQPPAERDNDLTIVRGAPAPAMGRVTNLEGRILDPDGRPIRNARVEIWQCDAFGRYHHPRDSGPDPDPGFQGFGHDTTDERGRYSFRTIRPVPYPGRTPHIHYAVFVPGQAGFTTQLYVAGESRNDGDFLFRAIPAERRDRVVAEFVPDPERHSELAARFDIVLAHRDGTPRM